MMHGGSGVDDDNEPVFGDGDDVDDDDEQLDYKSVTSFCCTQLIQPSAHPPTPGGKAWQIFVIMSVKYLNIIDQ